MIGTDLYWLIVTLFLGLTLGAAWRATTAKRNAWRLRRRLGRELPGGTAYASPEGAAGLAVAADGRTLVVVEDGRLETFPIERLLVVEGLRDGIVLVRSGVEVQPLEAGSSRVRSEVPELIGELSLRLTLDDIDRPAREIVFFRDGGDGARPSDDRFRVSALEIEAWRRRLVAAMKRAT